VAAPATNTGLAPLFAATGTAVEGSYIVVLKESPSGAYSELRALGNAPLGSPPRLDGRALAARVFADPAHVYGEGFHGFAAELDDFQIDALRRDPSVAYIEQDQVVTIATSGGVRLVSRMDSSMCITVEGGSSANDTRLILERCRDGDTTQLYERTAAGELRIFGKCVDAYSGRGNDGDRIVLWSCNGGQNQKWSPTSAGELKGINGKCMDAYGNRSTTGTRIVLWSCHGGTNQKWALSSGSAATSLSTTTQWMDRYGDPWGLDRISQRSLPLSGTYTYQGTGSGVRAYVIDTGIQADHSEFGSRARSVYDAFGGSGADCNGHGTAIAGTIGGTTFGVAKGVRIRSLKVADCDGSGRSSALLAAMDWVRRNHTKPAVVNLSIQTRRSQTINDATAALVKAGVFVSVAAGNNDADACNYSPGSTSGVLTVGATTKTDQRASYSNFGSCVHLYAPGTGIRSARHGSRVASWTGTSIAAPHVAGVAALYLHRNPDATPSAVRTWILSSASRGVVVGNPSGTPNRLLFTSNY
jgi:subtilisin family serine protease